MSRPRAAVFTAVDGTLLDAGTFSPGRNRQTVEKLRAAGLPVVPISVMTLEELAPVARDLGLHHAMVIEAGGAIARCVAGEWMIEPIGPPAEMLLDVIREIEDRSGARLFVQSLTPGRFSAPFVIEDGSFDDVTTAAASLGFAVRRGRHYFHLCALSHEGEAFMRLYEELRCKTAIAVGGAPVDVQFLGRADVAILVPGPEGHVDREVVEKLPHARIALAPAPDGWAVAVEEVVNSLARVDVLWSAAAAPPL